MVVVAMVVLVLVVVVVLVLVVAMVLLVLVVLPRVLTRASECTPIISSLLNVIFTWFRLVFTWPASKTVVL